MNYLLPLYPGDHAAWIFVSVILQVTMLTTFAILLTRFPVRRSAASRSAICLCTLACVLLIPLMAYGLDAAGVRFVRLPLFAMAAPEAETTISENTLHEIVEPDINETTPLPPGDFIEPREAASADMILQPAETSTQPVKPAPSYSSGDRWHAAISGLLVIWIAGMTVCVVRLLRGCLVLKRLRTDVRAIEDQAFAEVLKEVCGTLGMNRLPKLVTSRRLAGPVVTDGPGGPLVILPDGMLCDLDGRQLRDVLTHECAHLVQRDILVGMLQRTAQIIFWPHLLIHRLNGELTNAREDLCDNFVLRRGDAPGYARTLVEISQGLPETGVPIGACGMFDSASQLETRIVSLLNEGRNLMTRTKRSTLVILGIVFLATSALMSGSTLLKANAAETAAKAAQPSDVITESTLSGRVLGPNGKPIAGATVSVRRRPLGKHGGLSSERIVTTAKCRSDGTFTIVYPVGISLPGDAQIVAVAKGYGPDWMIVDDLKLGEEVALWLAVDDVPINGRVLDLQGRPIGGVTVTAGNIETVGLQEYLKSKLRIAKFSRPSLGNDPMARYRATRVSEQPLFPVRPFKSLYMDVGKTTTDDDGRFRLSGLGRDRLISLSFQGPTITDTHRVKVATQSIKAVELGPEYGRSSGRTIYGATFETVVLPSRTLTITGVVTDAASKQPIGGVQVQDSRGRTLTVTDEKGRYRLTGSKAVSAGLQFVTNNNQPYFTENAGSGQTPVYASSGASRNRENGPIIKNVELRKGIWITGRVVDQRTGEPVQSRIGYFPFLSNTLAEQFYKPWMSAHPDEFQTAPDGTFRIPGITGRGIITARSLQEHRYRYGVGAKKIEDLTQSSGAMNVYHLMHPYWVNTLREINVDPAAKEVSYKLELVSASRLLVQLVDSDQKPLVGTKVVGRFPTSMSINSSFREPPLAGDSFEVFNLDTDEPRTIILRHTARNLGKVFELKADNLSDSGTITVSLQPCGTISGRLLDMQGEPIREVGIFSSTANINPSGRFSNIRFGRMGFPTLSVARTSTDKGGRFEFSSVPPGASFTITYGPGKTITKVVKPGEKIDLGDLTVKTPRR